MAIFDDWMADAGAPSMLDTLGDSITYTPLGGASVTVEALVGRIRHAEDTASSSGITDELERDVVILRDASSTYGGVATPSLRDSVTIDALEWSVKRAELSEKLAKLVVCRKVDVEETRPEYRGR